MMKLKKLTTLILLLCFLLGGCTMPLPEATVPTVADGETLTVHFIDVGQADCALLECGGEFMLIDGGNREDSDLVVSYLEQQGVEELHTVVCTHAHEDHVGGLPAVLAVYPTQTVYSPTKTYASNIYDKFMYYVDQQGLEVTLPVPGDSFTLGGATVSILGPVKSYAETNDTSIVMKVEFGETSFLFTGDMEMEAENDMLDLGTDVKADVLKVGHHGSNTSSGYRFLYEVDPAYAVISLGRDNSYGHPHDEPMSRLRQTGCTIFRTDELGTILAVSDGTDISFTWAKQSANPENAEPADQRYIGNVNSQKFHAETCNALPAEKNRIWFDSYQEAVDAGYTPCGNCLG